MVKKRSAELTNGIGKQKQTKIGTLRHNADMARYMITGEKPSIPTYNRPGRGASGESSN